MKWTSEHTFDHPWQTVAHAAWRKYPNPLNGAVTGMDVLRQGIDDGVLKSERLLQSQFHIPSWVTKLTGFSGTQYSHEFSAVDPCNERMELLTRNLNAANFVRVDEKLVYTPHPDDHSKTLLSQEASVSVNLPAFTDYCERTFIGIYQTNAVAGRRGVEWVINHLKQEYAELSNKMSQEMLDISDKVISAWQSTPAS